MADVLDRTRRIVEAADRAARIREARAMVIARREMTLRMVVSGRAAVQLPDDGHAREVER